MSEWQPIETAPKNTRVLGALQSGRIEIVRWFDDKYNKKPRPCWRWYTGYITGEREDQPTHWMPLPEAPAR